MTETTTPNEPQAAYEAPAIYCYDRETGLLVCTSQADPNPMQEGDWLLPAFATLKAPPEAPQGQVAVFSEDNTWALLPDHRGTWYKADGQAVQIDDVQADVQGMVRTAPPSPDHVLSKGDWQISEQRVAARFAAYKTAQFSKKREEREVMINRLMGIAFAAEKSGDAPTVQACLAARVALLNLTKHASITSATSESALKAAFDQVYGAIVAACPANVQSIFKGMNT